MPGPRRQKTATQQNKTKPGVLFLRLRPPSSKGMGALAQAAPGKRNHAINAGWRATTRGPSQMLLPRACRRGRLDRVRDLGPFCCWRWCCSCFAKRRRRRRRRRLLLLLVVCIRRSRSRGGGEAVLLQSSPTSSDSLHQHLTTARMTKEVSPNTPKPNQITNRPTKRTSTS